MIRRTLVLPTRTGLVVVRGRRLYRPGGGPAVSFVRRRRRRPVPARNQEVRFAVIIEAPDRSVLADDRSAALVSFLPAGTPPPAGALVAVDPADIMPDPLDRYATYQGCFFDALCRWLKAHPTEGRR